MKKGRGGGGGKRIVEMGIMILGILLDLMILGILLDLRIWLLLLWCQVVHYIRRA